MIRLLVAVPEGISDEELEHTIRQRVTEAMRTRALAEGRPPYPPRENTQLVDRIEFIVTIGEISV